MFESHFAVYQEMNFTTHSKTHLLPVWKLGLPGQTTSSIQVPIMIELSLCFFCVHGHHVNYPSTRAVLFSSFQFTPLYLCFLCWEPVATLVWLFSSFLKTQLKCHLLWKGAACAQGWLVKFVFLVFPRQEAELLTVTSAREQPLSSF